MACPVCTHTMQELGNAWFWCPRCGTVKNTASPERLNDIDIPKGVEQARNWLLQRSVSEEHAREVLSYLLLSPDERGAS